VYECLDLIGRHGATVCVCACVQGSALFEYWDSSAADMVIKGLAGTQVEGVFLYVRRAAQHHSATVRLSACLPWVPSALRLIGYSITRLHCMKFVNTVTQYNCGLSFFHSSCLGGYG
jgi:hypothetical protein